MYNKYKEMPVLTMQDKGLKMQLELLVMINEKLDKLVGDKEPQITEKVIKEVYNPLEENLEEKTKKELITLAKDLQIEINPRDTKANIIETILK